MTCPCTTLFFFSIPKGKYTSNIRKKRLNECNDNDNLKISLRNEHNARERVCRKHIAKLFIKLSKCCSNMDTNRDIPTKISVLVAAKNEIDSLRRTEHKLLVDKQYCMKENVHLKKVLEVNKK